MNNDEARRLAAEAGLGRLDGVHLEQLAEAVKIARERAQRLPKDLHWTEEPIHSYRPVPRTGKEPR